MEFSANIKLHLMFIFLAFSVMLLSWLEDVGLILFGVLRNHHNPIKSIQDQRIRGQAWVVFIWALSNQTIVIITLFNWWNVNTGLGVLLFYCSVAHIVHSYSLTHSQWGKKARKPNSQYLVCYENTLRVHQSMALLTYFQQQMQ